MLEMGRGSSLSPAPEQMTSSIFLLDGQLPWMFRTDEASVEAGGCNTKGTICKHKYSSKKHYGVIGIDL